jgi:hypothetical protein
MHTKNRRGKKDRLGEDSTPPNMEQAAHEDQRADLVPLFRLLTRQPPADHDFRTCPICRRHRIIEI